MKPILACVIVALAAALPAHAATPALARAESNIPPAELFAAWSTLTRQHLAIERLPARSAALARACAALGEGWDKRFGPALPALDDALARSVEGWDNRRSAASDRITTAIESVSPDAATRELDAIGRALDGQASPPVIEIATALDPRYRGDGLAEFHDGLTRTDTSDGTGAAEGLSLALTTPRSWMPVHARGEGSVLRVQSHAGHGLASVSLRVLPLDDDEPEPDIQKLRRRAEPEAVKRLTPGAEPISHSDAMMLGRAGVADTYALESNSRYGHSRKVVRRTTVVLDRRLVTLTAEVADRSREPGALLSASELRAEFDQLAPLFDAIVAALSRTPGSAPPP